MRAPIIAASALALSACSTAVPASAPPTAAPSASREVSTYVSEFELYTHCGVREARVGDRYYEATPVLDDGQGNPPPGWGRGSTVGTMTMYADGTAHFSAPGGLEADFRVRPNATTWAVLCS
ncbi:MAG: hypothetical protein U0R76_01035 [Candidatus Nanopelagicales bacterium]